MLLRLLAPIHALISARLIVLKFRDTPVSSFA